MWNACFNKIITPRKNKKGPWCELKSSLLVYQSMKYFGTLEHRQKFESSEHFYKCFAVTDGFCVFADQNNSHI